jgi:hypothetical protein
MNNDTLDLGEREGGRRVGDAVGGTAAAVGCPLQPACKGRGMASVYRCAQPKAACNSAPSPCMAPVGALYGRSAAPCNAF